MENCNDPIQGSLSVHLPLVIIANLHTDDQEITTQMEYIAYSGYFSSFLEQENCSVYLLLTVCWFVCYSTSCSLAIVYIEGTIRLLVCMTHYVHSHGALTHLVQPQFQKIWDIL